MRSVRLRSAEKANCLPAVMKPLSVLRWYILYSQPASYNPYYWLRDVLENMHRFTANNIEGLLPQNWKKLPEL
jgi:hypothetical protein